jgi:putative addiction module CopG family antidote
VSITVSKKTEERLKEKIASGRYESEEDVIQAGLERLDEAEALRTAIAEAEEQIVRGQVVTETESRRRTKELLDQFRRDA